MSSQLHSQLELEKIIFNNLLAEGRNDFIAHLVLTRVENNIKSLERQLDAKKVRKKSNEPKHSRGVIRYVRQALHRFRDYANRRYNSIFQVPASTVLQAQAGSR